jgi:Carboxypeptidase regulatory-like domain
MRPSWPFVGALLLLTATATEVAQTGRPPTADAVILGKVTGAAGGAVLPGVVVLLNGGPTSGGPIASQRVLTDAQGRFLFRDLAAGHYRITATLQRYLPGGFGQTYAEGPTQTFDLAQHQSLGDVAIRLWRCPIVTGRVLDDAGQPIPRVSVEFLRADGGVNRLPLGRSNEALTGARVEVRRVGGATVVSGLDAATAVAGADGSFRAAALPGSCRVTASAPIASGLLTPKSAVVGDRDVLDTGLTIDGDGAPADLVVRFTDAVTSLGGRVIDAQGRRVSDLSVIVFPVDRASWGPASRRLQIAAAAADGSFTFPELPAGDYYAAAVGTVDPTAVFENVSLETTMMPFAIRVTIAAGEKKILTLQIAARR